MNRFPMYPFPLTPGCARRHDCRQVILLLALLVPAILGAQTPHSASAFDTALRIQGVFDSNLPDTEPAHALRLTLRPHFGDLHRRDSIRVPLGLRYGISERWEVAAEAESYFAHGIKGLGFFEEVGMSALRFETKYQWRNLPRTGWDAAIGFEYIRPVGDPPIELTDGLEHFMPFVIFAHRLESHPHIRVFWGVGGDFVNKTSIEVPRRLNALGADSHRINGGIIWRARVLTYTFEASAATTRLGNGPERDLYIIRPGVVWQVPSKSAFNRLGYWQVGVGLRYVIGPDSTRFGASVKVRVDYDFKQWIRSFGKRE